MKDQILDKANEMFLSIGFKSVTMDDIAVALGISKKTIYQHYANKHELVQASTTKLFHEISDGVDIIVSENHNPIEEFFVVRDFLSVKLNNESASPFYQLHKFFPEVSAGLHSLKFEKMYKTMSENLKRGISAGLYRQDIDNDFISRIYFSGLNATKEEDIFPPAMYNASDLMRQFLEYHLRAIVTEKGLQVLAKIIKTNAVKKK
ncbi:TetR family transcriptional regulator [Flavobacterium sp. Sd200]|uniref:TetR/AcrR family transcriptional regulator n=1 Tax=Flavobacterium sp. Sd200 TaxID=2692211 RepID=UPI00137000E4|nr:TetR/AcrR family transcriptional regulator [Flavobacterium sp. Sd200]MXN91496.1 TetR family transcriptional regulator [Flavobacterium sp. Sd200]